MPDLPDWGVGVIETVRDPLYDLAEAAVRLGYPGAYERGGNTIFFDDFSCGVSRWLFEGIDGYSYIKLSPSHNSYGGFAAELQTDLSFEDVTLSKKFPLENIGRWGLEVGIGGFDGVDGIVFKQILGSASGGAYSELWVELDNSRIRLFTKPASYVTVIDDFNFDKGDKVPFVFKLIADYDDKIYSQLYFNEYRRNLRDYVLQDDDSLDYGLYWLLILPYNDNGGSGKLWIDHIIVTTDEPDKVIEDS